MTPKSRPKRKGTKERQIEIVPEGMVPEATAWLFIYFFPHTKMGSYLKKQNRTSTNYERQSKVRMSRREQEWTLSPTWPQLTIHPQEPHFKGV